MNNQPVAMVAGEASGDLLASLLLGGLKQRLPDLLPYGIGGPRMVAQGFRADWPTQKLAVRGYVEVLRHYREISAIRSELKSRLLAQPPRAFIGVDAPDFNLDLEIALRASGIPTIHFIGPSIWAWRGERIEKIRRAVDHMLVIFPFEEELYQRAGIGSTYVGHPLADVIPMRPDRAAARETLGFTADDEVVAIMPGSRLSEISYIAPLFLDAVRLLQKRLPNVHFVIPTANAATRTLLQQVAGRGNGPVEGLTVLDGQSHAVLAACDAALVASGTATLETALFKRPMVIAYRMAALSWWMMRRKAYQPWVGLPNILAREFLVPELIQEAATPQALADAVYFQLRDDHNRHKLEQRFGVMHEQLRCNTAERASAVVARIVQGGHA